MFKALLLEKTEAAGFSAGIRPVEEAELVEGEVLVRIDHSTLNYKDGLAITDRVAACGLAQGFDLPTTVMPFILRGVTLCGIDSVMAPIARRREAWRRLAADLDPAALEAITTKVSSLDGAIAAAGDLMAGRSRGRIVVRI